MGQTDSRTTPPESTRVHEDEPRVGLQTSSGAPVRRQILTLGLQASPAAWNTEHRLQALWLTLCSQQLVSPLGQDKPFLLLP